MKLPKTNTWPRVGRNSLSALSMMAAIGVVQANDPTSIGAGGVSRKSSGVPEEVNNSQMNQQEVWTPEKYRSAKAIVLPRAEFQPADLAQRIQEEMALSSAGEAGEGEPGHWPTIRVKPDLHNRLFDPARGAAADQGKSSSNLAMLETASSHDPSSTEMGVPFNAGTRLAYFSSSRLNPTSADRSYPYATTGKLFFTTPSGTAMCTASVIRARLILTAGHCVHSGNGASTGWYSNFRFVPAFRDGAAPFKSWDWAWATTTTEWVNGGGRVPNTADYALIELKDQPTAGVSTRVGDLVGWLGYQTNSLLPNHVHMLGYPGAFDGGEMMHQVTAQSFQAGANNTVYYGSDMTQGSSGGPWIMNFGASALGQVGGIDGLRNRVVGVTSYGPNDTTAMVSGASILDSRFTTLMSKACAHKGGNC